MAVDANVVPEVTEVISGWMNETTLYYTYSTIAQTLAGAFGILGAFTLFHLQSINQSLKGICQTIHESLFYPSTYELPFYREDWSSFLDYLNEYITDEKSHESVNMKKSLYKLLKAGLKHDINYKKQVIKHLKIIAYLTAIAIILSLVALPFVLKLVNNPFFSKVLLGLTVALSIGCVYSYILIVIRAISHKVYKVGIGDTTKKNKNGKK